MNRDLVELLVCPSCLPREVPLRLAQAESDGGEIRAGLLVCGACSLRYPIHDGVPVLLPGGAEPSAEDRYARPEALSTYLWSHYADLWGDPEATQAYRQWRSWLPAEPPGPLLDLGCAVGRFTFELAAAGQPTVGLDRSLPFVRAAARLWREGSLSFLLHHEGKQGEGMHLTLPADWRRGTISFIVADAQSLPFASRSFMTLASLNLLDKLPSPRRHLAETSRVACSSGARLLVADPFSWSELIAPESEWLGGQLNGPFSGSGGEGVQFLLMEEISPPWTALREGVVPWRIRNHRNHFEQIRSDSLLFAR